MGIPSAIENLEKEVDDLHAKLYPQAEGDVKTEAEPAPAKKDDAEAKEEDSLEDSGEKEQEKAGEKEAAPAGDTVPKSDYDKVVHTLRTLQGKYNAEVPRFAAEVKELRKELESLRASREERVEAKKESDPKFTEKRKRLEEEWGQEFVSDFIELVKEEARAEIRPVQEKVESAANASAKSAESAYYAELTRLAPKWRTQNEDDAFNDWLDEPEGRTGVPRRHFLNEYHGQMNAEMVATFFNDFLGGKSSTRSKKADKESLVAPDSSGGQTRREASKGGEEYFKESQLIKFAQDYAAGKYSGREKEAEAIMARHEAAQSSGRILPG